MVDGVRAEKRGLALRREPFRPRALAEAVGATLAARAEAKGLAADVAIADDLPDMVIGDPRAAARRAGKPDRQRGEVHRARPRRACRSSGSRRRAGAHRLTFTITDSGIGLSRAGNRAAVPSVRQANATIARRYGGAGLGLAFVRRLAKAMGGDLTVDSRPGSGSTFRFSVTVGRRRRQPAARQAAAATQRRRAKACASCAPRTIPMRASCCKTMLVELGHRVDFAGSGEAAVAAVNRGGYDLVLMDVTLPEWTGLRRRARSARSPEKASGAGDRHLRAHRSARAKKPRLPPG